MQAPCTVDQRLVDQLLPAWGSGAIITCSLTPEQNNAVLQLASLPEQALSAAWEVRTMCLCLPGHACCQDRAIENQAVQVECHRSC